MEIIRKVVGIRLDPTVYSEFVRHCDQKNVRINRELERIIVSSINKDLSTQEKFPSKGNVDKLKNHLMSNNFKGFSKEIFEYLCYKIAGVYNKQTVDLYINVLILDGIIKKGNEANHWLVTTYNGGIK